MQPKFFECFSFLILLQLSKVQGASIPSEQLQSARGEAAAADLPFFIEFLDDFNLNMQSYTSYMNEAKMTLPQNVANYYYHLKDISETSELLIDLATSFPFTEFQTFITAFPWYSSILLQVSASTFYVPDDFITSATGIVTSEPPSSTSFSFLSESIQSMQHLTETNSTSVRSSSSRVISSSQASNSTTTTGVTQIQNSNAGAQAQLYIPILTLPIFCYFL